MAMDTSCLQATNTQHGLVRVSGEDAQNFLHAQFSNSVMNLQTGEVRFAAWCNAKGRVWTLVRYWKDGDAIILRMPADQLEATVKRLRMFVLRSDVRLEPMDWKAMQFLGPAAEAQATKLREAANGECYQVALPAAWPLFEIWTPAPLASTLPELPKELFALPQILSGQPEVYAAQREEWIPQMLNLDRLDGIDFRKGCYPGQEVVAKLHYKGGLKQRLHIALVDSAGVHPQAGAEILAEDGSKVGRVLESCGRWMTVVLRNEAIEAQLNLSDGSSILIPTE